VRDDQRRHRERTLQTGGGGSPLKSTGRTLEITGLGIIASFILAFWSLVGDGTLRLSQYLVFVALLLISAGGMVWRLWKLGPARDGVARVLEPGAYRVTFDQRGF
jgi:hypothetical protein